MLSQRSSGLSFTQPSLELRIHSLQQVCWHGDESKDAACRIAALRWYQITQTTQGQFVAQRQHPNALRSSLQGCNWGSSSRISHGPPLWVLYLSHFWACWSTSYSSLHFAEQQRLSISQCHRVKTASVMESWEPSMVYNRRALNWSTQGSVTISR